MVDTLNGGGESASSTATSQQTSRPQETATGFEGHLKSDYIDGAVVDGEAENGRRRLKSIIRKKKGKSSVNHSEQISGRSDRFETGIAWGQKAHKISFSDQIEDKPLVQVFQVESFKKYNAESGDGQDSPCCRLF